MLTGTGWSPTTPSVGGTGNVVFSKALVPSDETATFEIVVKVLSSVAGGSTITNTATAATNGATDTSFATFTVVVSKSNSNKDTNSVNAQAAAAKGFADANNGAPPAGYFVIGDGPIIGNKQ